MRELFGTFGRFSFRLARALILVLVAALLATAMVRLAPGFGLDEKDLNISFESTTPARVENAPNVLTAYGRFLVSASRGDFGQSTLFQQPVSTLIRERAAVTLRNVSMGFVCGWALALTLALANCWSGGTAVRLLSSGIATTLLCVPSAVLAFAAVALGASVSAGIAAVVFPRVFRYSDALLSQAAEQPFARAAAARGISRTRVLLNHVFRSVAAQHFALAGVTLASTFSAAIPMEVLCDSPGLGQLAWRAALGRDLPVVVAATVLLAAVTLVSNTMASAASSTTADSFKWP